MTLLHTLRVLTRTRRFSLTIAGTLAVGVAACTLTFGVVDAALWREPPFDDAAHIAIVHTERFASEHASHAERWSYSRIRLLRETSSLGRTRVTVLT